MSHVDEGALHAYLDGALEEFPTGEARRIRAHLERCEQCAGALAEARRVRDEADMLLAIPGVDVSAPPLEELRRLARSASEDAEGGESFRRRVPLYRLGWAASVVLALGVGWMLRGGAPESADPSGPGLAGAAADAGQRVHAESVAEESSSREATGALPTAPVETLASAGPPAERDAGLAERLPAAPVPSVVPEADVTAVEVADAGVPASAEDVVEEMAVAYEEQAPAPSSAEGTTADVAVAGFAQESVADTSPVVLDRVVPTSAERMSLATRSASGSALQGGGLAADDREVARQRGEDGAGPGSLVVPGLEVVTIAWREEGVVPAGVRVTQRLESGEVLELIHLPAGFDPRAVAPAAEGLEELVVPRDQGWLIMRAPLSEAELRALLERMDQPPPE